MHDVERGTLRSSLLADFLRGDVPARSGARDRKSGKPLEEAHVQTVVRPRVINVLRRAWFDAMERGFVAKNPFRKIAV